MANENAKIDQNYKKTLLAVTDDANQEIRRLLVDPLTGRLKCTAVIASGAITSLNGLNIAIQLFATGSAGTDFNIVSAINTHTFNIPSASHTNRGLLTAADWDVFTAKQNALSFPLAASLGGTGVANNVASTFTITGLFGITFTVTNTTTLTLPTGPGTVTLDYAQVVTVAKSGANFTTIQGAINSILDATSSKRYCIKIQSGVYSENVVMKDYVDLQGSGRTNAIISVTSGAALTFPAVHGTVMDMGITATYGALGSDLSAILTGGADSALVRCDVIITKTSGVFIMNGIKITGGAFRMTDTHFAYTITGASAAPLEQSAICQTGAATIVLIHNCEITMNGNDIGGGLDGFETLAGSIGTFLVQDTIFNATNTGAGGWACGLWLHGTATGATIGQNRITLSAPADTWGYYIQSNAGGAAVDSRHNEIITSGAGSNFFAFVNTGDTLNSAFDKVTAAAGIDPSGTGTVNKVSSFLPGELTVSGKINGLTLASQSVGFTIAGGTTSKTLTVDANWTASQGAFKTFLVVAPAGGYGDYVCDGTADDVQIQAAINAANAAGGGGVYIKAGTYDISAQVLHKANVWVRGDGMDVTNLVGSLDTVNVMWLIQNSSDVTLSDLTVNANYLFDKAVGIYRVAPYVATYGNIVVRNVHMTKQGATKNWLLITWDQEQTDFKLKDILFDNCLLDDCLNGASDNLAISYCQNVKFTNCTLRMKRAAIIYNSKKSGFDACTFEGFDTYGSMILSGEDVYCTNSILDNDVPAYCETHSATSVFDADGQIFSHNMVRGAGLVISDSLVYGVLKGVVVEGNTFDNENNAGGRPIRINNNVGAGVHAVISNNTLKNCRTEGMYISGSGNNKIVVSNNIIGNTRLIGSDTYYGILCYASNTKILGNYIYDDQVSPTSYQGIRLTATATNCVVEGNTVMNQTDAGITIASIGNKVNNNQLQTNSKGGILVEATSSYNLINSNYLLNNGNGTNNTYFGIQLAAGSTYNVVNGNMIYETAANKLKYGIQEVDSTADYNNIGNNTVQGAVTANFLINGLNTIYGLNIGS